MYYIYRLKIKKTMMASPAYHLSSRSVFFRPFSFFLFPFTKSTFNFLFPSGGGIRMIEKRREEKRREEKITALQGMMLHLPEKYSHLSYRFH
jgi:hypothetical protein